MDFRLPELGEGVYEAELVAWHTKPGDTVKRGQGLMEVMTDKATMEVPSPFAGTIVTLHGQPGKQLKVGDVVIAYNPAGQGENEAGEDGASSPARSAAGGAPRNGGALIGSAAGSRSGGPVSLPQAAPSVRHMARKLGIDLLRVRGSGPGGRILIDDLAVAIPAKSGERKPQTDEPRPDFGTPGTRIKMAGLRRKIAEHMVHANRTIPHYSYIDECDVTELVHLRKQLKEPYAQHNVKLTYLAFFVKAVALALKDIPMVNAMLDEATSEIVLHDRYHIGIAVATPTGLIVPVIHDADKKDLGQVARDIDRLSSEAKSGKIRLEDLRGSCFTVTSIGNVGGLISTPVINHPEVGILGVGKVIRRPVYNEAGEIRPADLIYLSFSFDHRVVDGAVGAAYGNAVIARLRNPAAMLIG